MGRLRAIVLIRQHNYWLVCGQFILAVAGIGRDDEQVSDHCLACGGTIQRDLPAFSTSSNCVGAEALAIVDVIYLDILELANPRCIQQHRVDPARPLVMEIRSCDSHPMELSLKHALEHF